MRSSLFLFPVFFGAFLAVFLVPFHAFAQLQGRYDAYEMTFNTDSPSPGESVDISIRSGKSFVSNIRSVRWFVDDRERSDFLNKMSISEIGSMEPKQIAANIIYFDVFGQRKQVRLVKWIRTAVFDILWEGDSVVIPLYRGHKLAGPQTPLNISAKVQYIDLNGNTHSEKDFSFRWEIESRFYGDIGPSQSSIVYEKGGTLLNDSIFVKAQATLINNPEIVFEKSIVIPIVEPRILLYPRTLLHGLSTTSAVPSSARLSQQPFSTSVYPFYFSKDDFDKNAIQYTWFVNNSPNHLKEGRTIDISIDGGDVSIPIRIHAENSNKKQQYTESFFTFSL